MTKFEEYKMVFAFAHPTESLKGWINEENYNNLFKEDWNNLMPLVGKCYYIDFEADDVEMQNLIGDISCAVLNIDIQETYDACVELIKYVNSKEL
jgi:hypothetical protein